jgi:hypothetical protein
MERLSPELRSLVDAERAEGEPSADQLERTRRALLARVGAAGAAAGVVGSLAKSASGAGAAPVAGALGKTTLVLALKVGVPVLIAGGVAAIAVPRWTEPAPRQTPAAVAPAKMERAIAAPEPPPHPEPALQPTSDMVVPPAPRVAPGASSGEHAVPSLAEEVRLLQEAQRSLKSGQPGAALAALAEHERRFPRGQLAVERGAVRIAALCALGHTAEAKQRGAAFLARHGGSAIAEQVRASCAGNGR